MVCTSALYAQQFIKEIPLKQQIEKSSFVVEGKVVAKRSFWDNNEKLIYTANTIEIYKVFKGQAYKSIEVITVGGTVGLNALMSSHSLKLERGDVGMFTLNNSLVKSDGTVSLIGNKFKAYGGQQAFYKYDLHNDVVSNPFGKKQGIKSKFYKEVGEHTKTSFITIKEISVTAERTKSAILKSSLALEISSFAPTTAMGGVKMELTISGNDFGGSIGKVGFANADDGGASFVDALSTQIVSWSNTQIVVEVPSGAGTGKLRITLADNSEAVESTDVLTISSSEVNVIYAPTTVPETPEVAYQVRHANIDGDGGYTWEMFTDFFDDSDFPGARVAYERAFDNWVCETGINWSISASSTTVDEVAFESRDGGEPVNVIRFDNGELDSETLGTCFYWFKGCGSVSSPTWYVAELDIVFNSEDITWNLGPEPSVGGKFDFESVVLHELGHGHLLAHVIDNDNPMYYAIAPNTGQRVIEPSNSIGANNIQDRSTGSSVCGVSEMSDASCPLSVIEQVLENDISIYPNPTKGVFYIKNRSSMGLNKAIIYDVSGRLILEKDISNDSNLKTINLAGVSKGVYFIDLFSDNGVITSKLILD